MRQAHLFNMSLVEASNKGTPSPRKLHKIEAEIIEEIINRVITLKSYALNLPPDEHSLHKYGDLSQVLNGDLQLVNVIESFKIR